MGKVAAGVFGALLLLVGMGSVRGLLAEIGQEETARWIGHALVVAFEVFFGAVLIVYAVRAYTSKPDNARPGPPQR